MFLDEHGSTSKLRDTVSVIVSPTRGNAGVQTFLGPGCLRIVLAIKKTVLI